MIKMKKRHTKELDKAFKAPDKNYLEEEKPLQNQTHQVLGFSIPYLKFFAVSSELEKRTLEQVKNSH